MVQERNVVTGYVEIPLVDLGHPRQLVQILNHPALGIVDDAAIFPEAHSRQFFQWRTGGVTGDLIIEFAAHDKIDGGVLKRLLRLNRNRWPDKCHLQLWVGVLHHFSDPQIDAETHAGREQH